MPNEEMIFSRVKGIKKSKLKYRESSDVMRSVKDLSLKENTKYVLMEYSVSPHIFATFSPIIFNFFTHIII